MRASCLQVAKSAVAESFGDGDGDGKDGDGEAGDGNHGDGVLVVFLVAQCIEPISRKDRTGERLKIGGVRELRGSKEEATALGVSAHQATPTIEEVISDGLAGCLLLVLALLEGTGCAVVLERVGVVVGAHRAGVLRVLLGATHIIGQGRAAHENFLKFVVLGQYEGTGAFQGVPVSDPISFSCSVQV